jgi:hypothetical protein
MEVPPLRRERAEQLYTHSTLLLDSYWTSSPAIITFPFVS